jgi:secreted PhoX family phosphatase
LEVTDRRVLSCPDNLIMAPWGDVLMAEDNYQLVEGVRYQYIRGMTPEGNIYDLVKNPQEVPEGATRPGAEFTGLCFSPDGKVLFANLQSPINTTFAIQGPWSTDD